MPVVLLRLPSQKTGSLTRPSECPYCGGTILQGWGRIVRTVCDTKNRTTEVQRYRCCTCGRTFREYPRGIDNTSQTLRIRYLAALAWAMGMSYRDVSAFFEKKGIRLSHTTIWRDGQKLLAQLSQASISDPDDSPDSSRGQKYALNQDFLIESSPKLGIVVVIDLGDGQHEVLGTIDEYNPKRMRAWLEPLVRDIGIEVLQLGTGFLSQ